MSSDFINYVVKRCRRVEGDRDTMIFKIVMEIHSCHQKILNGLRSDISPEASLLLEYYKNLAGGHSPNTHKIDTVFFDCRDIAHVYSVELDCTFPLVAYPYKLFIKNKNKITPPKEDDIKIMASLDRIKKENINIKEYVEICRLLDKLSEDSKEALDISIFLPSRINEINKKISIVK